MEALTVLECPYPYAAWYANNTCEPPVFRSSERHFEHRPMTDDFRACGLYAAAGVPYEVQELRRETYPELPPHEAVPRDVSDRVCEAILAGRHVLLASGYCVYAPAAVGGMQRALGTDARIGIVWIDAHADCVVLERKSEMRPTLVGIPLSSALGLTAETWRADACGLTQPISPQNVLASDLRRSDDASLKTVLDAGCTVLDEATFEDGAIWEREVRTLAERVDAIYLAIDADILRPEFVPAYFRPEPGGHTPETVVERARAVLATGKVRAASTFCFDFDKTGPERDVTCLNAMRVIGGVLQGWHA